MGLTFRYTEQSFKKFINRDTVTGSWGFQETAEKTRFRYLNNLLAYAEKYIDGNNTRNQPNQFFNQHLGTSLHNTSSSNSLLILSEFKQIIELLFQLGGNRK